jgi:hypothetical protein
LNQEDHASHKASLLPNMELNIAEHGKTCSKCLLHASKREQKVPLMPITTQAPFELISIDIAGPLKKSNNKQYIIAAVDLFSKFRITKAISDITAMTTAKFFFFFR